MQNWDQVWSANVAFAIAVVSEVLLYNMLSEEELQNKELAQTQVKILLFKLQSAVFQQLGPQIFHISGEQFVEHRIRIKSDHLSSLLRITMEKYVDMSLKMYGKRFSEMVVHNIPPLGMNQPKQLSLETNRWLYTIYVM